MSTTQLSVVQRSQHTPKKNTRLSTPQHPSAPLSTGHKPGCLFCSGGMIFTFYKARGMSVGSSLVEEDKLDLAKKLEAAAKEKGVEFILPTDIIAADKFDENAETQVVAAGDIPDGWMVCPSCRSLGCILAFPAFPSAEFWPFLPFPWLYLGPFCLFLGCILAFG